MGCFTLLDVRDYIQLPNLYEHISFLKNNDTEIWPIYVHSI